MQKLNVNSGQPFCRRTTILGTAIGCLFLALAVGCSIEKTTATVNGDTTNVRAGQGTATVAGVQITVEDLQKTHSGINSGTQISERADGITELETRKVTLGEVEITLTRLDQGPLQLQVGGTAYGEVKSGDEIRIDGERRLFVNGTERRRADEPVDSEDGSDGDVENESPQTTIER